MIKQTHLIFRIKSIELEVYEITVVGGTTPLHTTPSYAAPIVQEIWWVDKENPFGHGPFQTVYGAMKHYNEFKRPTLTVAPPDADLIQVDFTTKKRL
jgi:hypothetical protein